MTNHSMNISNDIIKIKNTVGRKPSYNLRKGLEKTIDGYKKWFITDTLYRVKTVI